MAFRADASTEGLTRTASLPSSTAFTIGGWFRKRGTGDGSWETIAGLLSSGGSYWAVLYNSAAGSNIVRIHGGSGDASLAVTLTTDTWYYFAIGSNGTTDTSMTGWIITTAGTVYTASTYGVSFTAAEMSLLKNTAFGEWVNGAMANVMVWNTKLTTAELQQQMWSAVPIVQQSSIHLWTPLWTTAHLNDYSGNARSWTSAGGTPSTEDGPPVSWGSPPPDILKQPSGSAPINISIAAAALAAAGRSASVLKGRVSASIAAAVLASAGRPASVLKGGVSASIAAAVLASAGRPASVLKGGVSAAVSTVVLASAGRVVTVAAGGGPINIAVTAAHLQALELGSTINASASISVTARVLQSLGLKVTVVPGARSVPASAAVLQSLGLHANTLPGGRFVQVTAAQLQALELNATVVPGSKNVPIVAAILDSNGRPVAVTSGGALVQVSSIAGGLSGRSVVVVPGARSVLLNAAMLDSNAHSVGVTSGGALVLVSAAAISSLGRSGSVRPGSRSISLGTAQLQALELNATVRPGQVLINTGSAQLQALGLDATVQSFLAVQVSSAIMAAQEQTVGVVVGGTVVQISAALLRSAGLRVTPAAVLVYLELYLQARMIEQLDSQASMADRLDLNSRILEELKPKGQL